MASVRWLNTTGEGSWLGAPPRLVTSFSISHTVSMYRPSATVLDQVIKAATANAVSLGPEGCAGRLHGAVRAS